MNIDNFPSKWFRVHLKKILPINSNYINIREIFIMWVVEG